MLLLAENHTIEPFAEASAIFDDPALAQAVAKERGYVYFKSLLGDETIAPLRAFVRDFAAGRGWVEPDPSNPTTVLARAGAKLTGRGWDDPDWLALQNAFLNHPSFQPILHHPRILRALELLLGEPAAPSFANHCWLKLPGSPEHTTRPHQDISYLPDCPRMWTVWVPLVDTPMEVGPLGVVSGSRHRDDWNHVDNMTGIDMPPDVTWATGDVAVGDIVIFDASTIHCAWSNVSPTFVRLSLDIRYEARETERSILRPSAAG